MKKCKVSTFAAPSCLEEVEGELDVDRLEEQRPPLSVHHCHRHCRACRGIGHPSCRPRHPSCQPCYFPSRRPRHPCRTMYPRPWGQHLTTRGTKSCEHPDHHERPPCRERVRHQRCHFFPSHPGHDHPCHRHRCHLCPVHPCQHRPCHRHRSLCPGHPGHPKTKR